MVAMDWHSWLSQTSLDPYLVYEYGRAFTHNELQRGDTSYFTHEFLRSMGVSVAKHRLEIMKLARKNIRSCPFSKLISVITNTKMLFSKKLGKCVMYKHSVQTRSPEHNPFRPQWPSINLRKDMGFHENVIGEKQKKKKTKSGPLDRRLHQSYISPKQVSSISGPLDTRVQKTLMARYTSPVDTRLGPNGSGPLDDVDYIPKLSQAGGEGDALMSSLWSLMFQNIRPT